MYRLSRHYLANVFTQFMGREIGVMNFFRGTGQYLTISQEQDASLAVTRSPL